MIKALVFAVTYNCNARCVMCSIHERESVDRDYLEFEEFFSHPKLNQLESINISGGEPLLREDILDLITLIASKSTYLHEITINSNGFFSQVMWDRLVSVLDEIDPKIKIRLFISLDSLTNKSDIIRGVKDASDRALRTLKKSKKISLDYNNFEVGVSCTVTKHNVYELDEIREYCVQNQFSLDFVYATVNDNYINSRDKQNDFTLNKDEKEYFIAYLNSIKNDKDFVLRKLYYEDLIALLKGNSIDKKCIFKEGKGLLLDAEGCLSICGMTSESILGNIFEELLDDIINTEKCAFNRCSTCETNSYYEWYDTSSLEVKTALFREVKKLRKEVKNETISRN